MLITTKNLQKEKQKNLKKAPVWTAAHGSKMLSKATRNQIFAFCAQIKRSRVVGKEPCKNEAWCFQSPKKKHANQYMKVAKKLQKV